MSEGAAASASGIGLGAIEHVLMQLTVPDTETIARGETALSEMCASAPLGLIPELTKVMLVQTTNCNSFCYA